VFFVRQAFAAGEVFGDEHQGKQGHRKQVGKDGPGFEAGGGKEQGGQGRHAGKEQDPGLGDAAGVASGGGREFAAQAFGHLLDQWLLAAAQGASEDEGEQQVGGGVLDEIDPAEVLLEKWPAQAKQAETECRKRDQGDFAGTADQPEE